MKDRLNAITALLAVIAFMLTVLVIQNTLDTISIKIDHKHRQAMGYHYQGLGKQAPQPSNPIASNPIVRGKICPMINNDGTLLLIDQNEETTSSDSILTPLDEKYCMPMGTTVESNSITNLPGNVEDMPTINNDFPSQRDNSVGGSAGSTATGVAPGSRSAKL